MKMMIAGQWADASGMEVIDVYDPATHELLDTVPKATELDLQKALEAAQEGKAIWGSISVQERTDVLLGVSELIRKEKRELATLLARETGKIYPQAEEEVDNAIALFKGYAEKVRHFYDSVLPCQDNMIVVKREPVGVVACIIPFNFPIDLYSHKVAPALAAGNAVIIKPASDTPLANIYLSDLIVRAGVPGKAVQVVTGSGAHVGRYLAESPLVNAVSLTGSTSAGIDVRTASAKNLTRTYLELGGNDPMIVFEDVDPEKAAQEAVNCRILNAGQACCSTKRFIVHNKIKESFTAHLIEKLRAVKIGKPFDPEAQAGAIINEKSAIEVEEAVQLTISQGAVLALGGKRFNQNYFEMTVLTDVTPEMDIANDMEVFGPVFPVIGFDTEDEAVSIANQGHYGLSSGVMCGDIKKARRIADRIDAGSVIIGGGSLYRTFDMPFGGHKMSGMGTEGFYNTLDEYFQTKSVVFKGINA